MGLLDGLSRLLGNAVHNVEGRFISASNNQFGGHEPHWTPAQQAQVAASTKPYTMPDPTQAIRDAWVAKTFAQKLPMAAPVRLPQLQVQSPYSSPNSLQGGFGYQTDPQLNNYSAQNRAYSPQLPGALNQGGYATRLLGLPSGPSVGDY